MIDGLNLEIKKKDQKIAEFNKYNHVKIVISGIIQPDKNDAKEQGNNINEKLRQSCESKGIPFTDNKNTYIFCLNGGNQYLDKNGTPYLANIFKNFISSF